MMANAGFENSYGTRDVEDDLEDYCGDEWYEHEEAEAAHGAPPPQPQPQSPPRDLLDVDIATVTPTRRLAGGALAPLGMESRAELGSVFDMVADEVPARGGGVPGGGFAPARQHAPMGGGGAGAGAGGGGAAAGAERERGVARGARARAARAAASVSDGAAAEGDAGAGGRPVLWVSSRAQVSRGALVVCRVTSWR